MSIMKMSHSYQTFALLWCISYDHVLPRRKSKNILWQKHLLSFSGSTVRFLNSVTWLYLMCIWTLLIQYVVQQGLKRCGFCVKYSAAWKLCNLSYYNARSYEYKGVRMRVAFCIRLQCPNLQPHYGNKVFGNVYLSAGLH